MPPLRITPVATHPPVTQDIIVQWAAMACAQLCSTACEREPSVPKGWCRPDQCKGVCTHPVGHDRPGNTDSRHFWPGCQMMGMMVTT